MLDTIYGLRGTNAVCIVGVGIAVKGRELSAPIIPFSLLSVKKNSAPEGAEKETDKKFWSYLTQVNISFGYFL